MYAVPSMLGLMTSNTKEHRNNKTTKTTTTAASNQSIKPKTITIIITKTIDKNEKTKPRKIQH